MFHRNFGLKKTFDVATLETQKALMKAIKNLAFEYKPTYTLESLLNDTFLIDRSNKNEPFNSVMIYALGGIPLNHYEEFIKKFGFKDEVIKVFIR